MAGGSNGDNGSATSAEIDPSDVAVDNAGNIFIAEFFDVRKVTVATGIITTIAASNTGTSLTAQNVFVDQSGNVYISDYGHSRVYELDSSLHSIAGTGSLGISGDGGPPARSFSIPAVRGCLREYLHFQ